MNSFLLQVKNNNISMTIRKKPESSHPLIFPNIEIHELCTHYLIGEKQHSPLNL